MTKKIILFIIIVILFVPALFAQTQGILSSPGETILQSYERIFIRSSLSTKVNVLSDAANDEAASEFYGQLCELALRFVIDNASLFRNDPDMISIAIAAVRGVGEYTFFPATEAVWQVFLRFPDKVIRYEILEVLPELDTQSLTGQIIEFLAEQNRRNSSGIPSDEGLLLPLFAILGSTGDESCYPVLLASSVMYSDSLEEEAIKAIYKIGGNILDFCFRVIIENPPEEKLSAFKLVLSWEGLSGEEKCKLAETALEVALAVPGDRRSGIQELSEASLLIIRETGWVRALPQVLKYYNQSLVMFRADLSFKQPLINAIYCLGNLRNADAAQILALQLGLYNSRSADLETEEQEIVLALINALGELAYKASYDGLHYATMLPYPATIIEAAQTALSKLKW
ncbi:MAG: hypothetical protein FWG07_09885 [Treponema sp.]|nr:hypothetical protein [Treponema sp.]